MRLWHNQPDAPHLLDVGSLAREGGAVMLWDLNELRKPVNLVFLGIGVVGLVATVITYLWSLHESNISYHTATIQIVDQKEVVPFTVIDSDGQRVTENVFATNVTVWNSGDLPIDVQYIRTPLTISLTIPVRLIDVKLEHATSENISEFHIDGEPKKSGVIQIGWRYFDPKEGFRLRIIYAAKEMSSVRLNGVIFGVTNFNDITPPPKGEMSLKSPGFVQLMIAAVLGVGFSILHGEGRGADEETGTTTITDRTPRHNGSHGGGGVVSAMGDDCHTTST